MLDRKIDKWTVRQITGQSWIIGDLKFKAIERVAVFYQQFLNSKTGNLSNILLKILWTSEKVRAAIQ